MGGAAAILAALAVATPAVAGPTAPAPSTKEGGAGTSTPGAAVGGAAGVSGAAQAPEVYPVPQELTAGGDPVPLAGRVTLVVGEETDAAAIAAAEEIIAGAGGKVTTTTEARGKGKEVYLGTVADNPALAEVLAGMGVENATDLPEEGYVLASGRHEGRPVVVLNGADARGTFYATQTLRQVVEGKKVPGLEIRDWPLMSIRGAIEGFYGIPWSHQSRLDHMEFYGEHKMNTYIYTPKDDLLLRYQWRELYSGDDLARMEELVDAANANHVDFTFALSPGNDICYSSQEDFDATIAKFEQLRELGVDSFYVALDDIPLRLHCDADRAKYPNQGNWYWLADAQTDYLNRIQTEYIEPNGLEPLQTVPTNYAGSGEDPYKGRFGDRLDDDVRVQWTGEGVFSDTITEASVRRASQSYRTEHLYIWDNFPVNDGRRSRLFLNPLTGRDPGLYQHIEGFTSNPMIQPYASLPALGNYADYTWNGPAYDADTSMAAVLAELAGDDPVVRDALVTFADLNQSWPYRDDVVHAPALSADVEAFWAAYEAGDASGATALRERLSVIRSLPEVLPTMAEPGFAADAQPWVDAAAQWATALEHEIAMLEAIAADDGATATAELLAAREWIARTAEPTLDDQGGDGVRRENVLVPSVGDGVFEDFSDRAMAAYADWLGAEPAGPAQGYPAAPSSSMGTYQNNTLAKMVDGDPATLYWSNEAGQAGDYVQVDLGEVREIGSVAVHQSDSDTQSGDMFYTATLQYSADGQTWTDAGEYISSPLVAHTFDTPVQARYVRLLATADNSGGQWVKIREFVVSAPSGEFETNLASVPGEGAARAFDGDVATSYVAASAPVEGSFLARNLDEATTAASVAVVGSGSGEIQVARDGEWVTVGELTGGAVFHEAALDGAAVDGVRLLFAAGSAAPRISEIVLR
ncbi:hyaluronoglucosaminidase [Georgenia soli]|uniref:Hyaluronoglucosaminidase n=2 Tax=Georgenia soli TaxID=638953 RepID=A0A2A9EMQ3_9MICO|nr:hyaluronoglucosaminidase [Georgenia soli]